MTADARRAELDLLGRIYRRKLEEAALSRERLYDEIIDAAEDLTVREIAAATRLSPGRVSQIQHGH